MRRGSIVGPVIILAVGIVFLLAETGRLSWGQSFEWYGRWWPAVLIAAGIVLLIEWAVDQRVGQPAGGARVVGGGVVFLLILLALTGLTSRAIQYGLAWRDNTLGDGYGKLDYILGDRHDADSTMNWAMGASSSLVIRDPHGDVTVSGSSSDGQVHVNIHTQTYGWKESDVERKATELQPTFSSDRGVLTLNVKAIEGGEADLTIEIPHATPLTIQADRGDVTVSEMAAPVIVSANHGDVDISAVAGPVTMHTNDDNSSVTVHSVTGAVSLAGHSGDIDISEVNGDLTLQGDFFGSTDLEHVDGWIHFDTSRTQFSAARLDDEFSIDSNSLNASELLGPVVLKTQDKDVTLDRVQGSVNISNRNGSIELTSAAPLSAISVDNRHGSVDVGLPGSVGFALDAQTRNGDIENDFNLTPEQDGDNHTLKGLVANGGPTITIATTDGDVTVRRSIVAPLPPVVPSTNKITLVPTRKTHRVPKTPQTPASPAPPHIAD